MIVRVFAGSVTRRRVAGAALASACAVMGLALGAAPASAIVGGEAVRRGDIAARATVKVESTRGELCSGVPLQPRIVLTAAHCVIGGGQFRVTALDRAMRRRTLSVARIQPHESFLPGRTPSTQPGVDLAVLLLASPMPETPALTFGGAIGVGDRLTIAGFGLSQEGRRQTARTLRQTELTTAGAYTSANSVVVAVDRDNLGQSAGAGACKGDSGGPIFRGGELVGVISWSSGPINQRVRSVCGGFTAMTPVASHRGWIDATAASLMAAAPEAPPARPGRRGPRQEPPPAPAPPPINSDSAR
jgi:secreted trypsin-like serine protease